MAPLVKLIFPSRECHHNNFPACVRFPYRSNSLSVSRSRDVTRRAISGYSLLEHSKRATLSKHTRTTSERRADARRRRRSARVPVTVYLNLECQIDNSRPNFCPTSGTRFAPANWQLRALCTPTAKRNGATDTVHTFKRTPTHTHENTIVSFAAARCVLQLNESLLILYRNPSALQ